MGAKLLFVVTVDWYFCSHRLDLAVAAREAGYEVYVATQVSRHAEQIRHAGLQLLPLRFPRSLRTPWQDLLTLIALIRLYRRLQPDVIHHVALKPILLGSLAAAFARRAHTVNAITGLGFLFASARPGVRLLRFGLGPLLRWCLRAPRAVNLVQNEDDLALLRDQRLADPHATVLIEGSGVDTARFAVSPEPAGVPVILFVGRLLEDKGIREFVAAAERLHERGLRARFVAVGTPDPENHASISAPQWRRWQRQGTVEWWGERRDLPRVLAQAHVVCLPSYREGLPKVLIEGAACGRALVATDVPGCRQVVRDGDNGLLVPARDADALADALARLVSDPALRARMGARSREIAVARFDCKHINAQTLALYERLLQTRQHNPVD